MAEKKEPRDEKLIEELYERLWWYTYEASEEEFDEKEVDAITRLLDVLEPVHDDTAYEPGADAALKRFWERYGEEEENAAMEDSVPEDGASVTAGPASLPDAEIPKPDEEEHFAEEKAAGETLADEVPAKSGSGRKWRKRLIRIAVGVAACVVLLISVNVGSYALRKKSFFEIVREEVGRTEITVTGNTEEIEENNDNAIECSTWAEVEEIVGVDILVPAYLPEGFEVSEITIQVLATRDVIIAKYKSNTGKNLRFEIDVYQKQYEKDALQYKDDWEYIEEDRFGKKAQYYKKDNLIDAFFIYENSVYYILTDEDLEVVKKIVSGMN